MNNNIFTLKNGAVSDDEANALSVMNSELLADQSKTGQRGLHLAYSGSVKQIKSNIAQNSNEILRVKNADYIFDTSTFQNRETILNMRRDFIDYTFFRKENIHIQDFIQSVLSSAENDIKMSEDIQVGGSTFLIGNPFTRQSLLYKLRRHPSLQSFAFEGVNIENNVKQGAAIKVTWPSLIDNDGSQKEVSKPLGSSFTSDNHRIGSGRMGGNTTVYADFSKKIVLDEVRHVLYEDYPILLSHDDGLSNDIAHLHRAAETALYNKRISGGYVDMVDIDNSNDIVLAPSFDNTNNIIPFPVKKGESIDSPDTTDSASFATRIGSKIRKYSEKFFKGVSSTFSSIVGKFRSKAK